MSCRHESTEKRNGTICCTYCGAWVGMSQRPTVGVGSQRTQSGQPVTVTADSRTILKIANKEPRNSQVILGAIEESAERLANLYPDTGIERILELCAEMSSALTVG